jgi:chromosome segregation ATPase
LTDRQSAIDAASETARRLDEKLAEQRKRRTRAENAVTRAEELLSGAHTAAEMTGKQAELDQLLSGAHELTEKIAAAKKKEDDTRAAFDAAPEKFDNADQRRAVVKAELGALAIPKMQCPIQCPVAFGQCGVPVPQGDQHLVRLCGPKA